MRLKSARFMDRHAKVLVAILGVLACVTGCKPKIGDECTVSTDCSSTGDRLCDTTQPAGYCTIFNCEPGTCPEEAICVAFNTSKSNRCDNPQDSDRLQRTFCMRSCDSDSDCRAEYSCIDLNDFSNPWGAAVVEDGPVNGKVCIVPYSGADATKNKTEVCTGTDAGVDAEIWSPDTGVSIQDAATDVADDADDASTDLDAGLDASDDADADLDGGSDAATDS